MGSNKEVKGILESLNRLIENQEVDAALPKELAAVKGYGEIYTSLLQIREALLALSQGDLAYPVSSKGFFSGAIKGLQASMQHLIWQIKAVDSGDFTQRVDFLGTFSESFNSMTDRLASTIRELEQSEERYKYLFEYAGVGIAYYKIDGTIISYNKMAAEHMGGQPEDYAGKSIYEFFPKEDADFYMGRILKAVTEENSLSYEDNLTLNHNTKWFFSTFNRIMNTNGGIAGIEIISSDITARKLMEEALKASEESNRLLITQMQQGLALHEVILDDSGKPIDYRFLSINKSFERLTGLKSEDIIGKTVLEVLPGTEQYWIEKYGQVAMTGEPLQYDNYSKELDKHYEVVAYSPRPKLFAVVLSDITERKRLERDFLNEKKLLETTLYSVGDGVISTDNNGTVVFLNRVSEVLTGWSQEEAKGKQIEEIFHIVNEHTREKSEDIVNKVLKSRKVQALANHTLLISKEGVEWPIEDSAAPIVEENGRIVGVVLVFRDVSEKKLKQREIEFLSYHDQLTGLYNRRFYEEELARLDTERNLPLTIAMGDVNGLKLINDSFGHAMGDELLKRVAAVIKKGCRADDIIARLGGDEFLLILPNTDSLEAEKIMKRITSLACEEKVMSFDISVSFGWDTKVSMAKSVQESFKNAEDYMYRRKLYESPSMRGKTIRAIITTLYEKNKREEQHSHRVSALCKNMGIALNLDERVIEDLKTVGLLHDIGKIAVDENILNKPGRLTDEEREEIRRHPEKGYRILSTVNDMSEMAEYVLAHHERWDGRGYPKGLKGNEIPLVSRIISIADAYDAMTSERSYRCALSEKAVKEKLVNSAGYQFDPFLLNVFIEKVMGQAV